MAGIIKFTSGLYYMTHEKKSEKRRHQGRKGVEKGTRGNRQGRGRKRWRKGTTGTKSRRRWQKHIPAQAD